MANVFKRFLKGILLVGETSDPSDNKEGSIFHNFSESRLKTYIGGAVREVITNSQGQSLTNKTIIVSSNSILTAASGNLSSTELNAALAELQSDIDSRATSASLTAHLNDFSDAHDAAAISFDKSAFTITSNDVQGAIGETWVTLQGHIADSSDAHDASAISVIPSGTLASTDVQAALQELQTDVDSRVNTASNVGTGSGVFKQKSGSTLELKSLSAGSNITITEVGDSLQLSASGTIGVNDATTSVKGIVKLAGDLGGTADLPTVPALSSKAPLASPALTGTPTAPTAPAGTNTTQIATTEFVSSAANSVFKAGDSKLSYADPGTDWTLANGGTLYKNENTELYSLFGTELSSPIQTLNPPDITANANNRIFFISDNLVMCITGQGDQGATNTGNIYTAPYNTTTRTIGTYTRIDNTLGIPSVANDFKQIGCVLYPYIFIFGSASFNIHILKYDGISSFTLTQTISLSGAWHGAPCAFTARGNDYLAVRQGSTIRLYERNNEVWSVSSTTVDSLSSLGTITNSSGACLAFWDSWAILSVYDSISASYKSRILKYNSFLNSYQIHSSVSGILDGPSAYIYSWGVGGGAAGPIKSGYDELFTQDYFLIYTWNGSVGTLKSYKYNSNLDSWESTATITLGGSLWGGYVGFVRHLRSSYFSPELANNSYYQYNNVDKILYFIINNTLNGNLSKIVTVQIINGVAIAGENSSTIYTGGSGVSFIDGIPKDAGILITPANANSSAGQFLICPLRKTLPNLASPSLGLNYYLKK